MRKLIKIRLLLTFYHLRFHLYKFYTNILTCYYGIKLNLPYPVLYWGRRDSPEPIRCECGWAGPVKKLIHTYAWYGEDENGGVEPVDQCPRCKGEL